MEEKQASNTITETVTETATTRDRMYMSAHSEDPQPSTSRGTEGYHHNRRQSEPVPLQPRIRQYEPNALLQKKNDTGITEFEQIVQERELMRQLTIHECVNLEQTEVTKILLPRGPTFEQNALLAKNASGLSEIESYLKEKEQEISRRSNSVGASDFFDPQHRFKLQPRTPHIEINPLLQCKDSTGRSELEQLLCEKERELQKPFNSGASKTENGETDKKTEHQLDVTKYPSTHPIQSKSSIKKVHFERTDSEERNLEETTADKNSDKKQSGSWRIGKKQNKGTDSKLNTKNDTEGTTNQDNGPKPAKATNNNKKSSKTNNATQSNSCCAIS